MPIGFNPIGMTAMGVNIFGRSLLSFEGRVETLGSGLDGTPSTESKQTAYVTDRA